MTSSALVGSSASSSFGSPTKASAITTRCQTTGQLVPVATHTAIGLGDSHDPQQLDGRPPRAFSLPDAFRLLQRLLELIADG